MAHLMHTRLLEREPCKEMLIASADPFALAPHSRQVPLYDRACNSLGSYKEAPRGSEPSGPRPVERAMNRCFNCGSYL